MLLLKGGDMIMKVTIGVSRQEYGLDQFGGMFIYPGKAIYIQQPKFWKRHVLQRTVF